MSALVQIMAWRRPGDKPLYEPMLTRRIYAALGGDLSMTPEHAASLFITPHDCGGTDPPMEALRFQIGGHFADDMFKRIFLSENI